MGKEHDLLNAARCGDILLVEKILEQINKRTISPFSSFRRSPNLNHQDVNGYTALHHACLNGHLGIVRLLLVNHVVPDVSDIRGSTPLYLAAWAGHHEIVKILLTEPRKHINVNVQTSDNETPLHCAAQHGHSFVLEILLAHGADPAIRNNSFQTALDLAAHFGRLNIVQTLIRTNPQLLDAYRSEQKSNSSDAPYDNDSPTKHIFTHTCLHLASRHGHKQVVEALLAAGVDVNIMTHAGTALHEAALCVKQSVVSILLRAGVDIYALDGNGHTALDLLKDYPPHVTYGIVKMIKEHTMGCYFMPKNSTLIEDAELLEEKSIGSETESNNNSAILRFQPQLLTEKAIVAEQAPNQNSYKSGQYLQMKQIEPDLVNGISVERYSPKHIHLTRTRSETLPSRSNHSSTPPRRFKCIDEYVEMSSPNFKEQHTKLKTTRKNKPPVPSPRIKTDCNDYANIDISSSTESNSGSLSKYKTDNNNNSTHSPTPDIPPPSVTEAEHSILEFIHPQSTKAKRSSLRLSQESELNLNAYLIAPVPSPVESRRSNASDCVEKFVGDEPFAGLFKGSTLNLAGDDKETDRRSLRLRSPSLVRSAVTIPLKKQATLQNLHAKIDQNLDEVEVWQEINTILESIGNEFKDTNMDTLTERKKSLKQIQMRHPSDLQLRTSRCGSANNWCHAPNTLIYGQIIYRVYYLGSTIIRELHGTLSTRKSIQKLKCDEKILQQELDANLVKDCNKLTRILKENNEQKRHEVEISISCVGVGFIEMETKIPISLHAIENINCVCQDNEDLRYFAYITMEKNLHYCHVFMVDNLDLATEIILTLGQAFEVAYQLAINKNGDSSG